MVCVEGKIVSTRVARFLAVAVCLALAACGQTTSQMMLKPVEPSAHEASTHGTKRVPILVATPRGRDEATGEFNNERTEHLTYNSIVVSLPPGHAQGEVEWPPGPVGDLQKHFVTLANTVMDEATVQKNLDRYLPPSGDVFVFMHGYNTTYQEGVYRLAQIAGDANLKALPLLFSWPSRGDLTDYLTDRESAMASRNRLMHLLEVLARHPRVHHIDVMAHSMGSMLTMETLVQLKLKGNGELNNKLNTLVLAAPDIDVDVFRAQFEIIGKRNKPTIVMTSRDDRALNLSRRIAGNVVRAGNASIRAPKTIEFVEKMGLTVFDMTEMRTSDKLNHSKFASFPTVVQQLGTRAEQSQEQNPITAVGTFFIDAAGEILATPSNVLSRVTGR